MPVSAVSGPPNSRPSHYFSMWKPLASRWSAYSRSLALASEGVEKVGDCAKPLLLGAPNGARSRVAPGDRTPFRGEGTRGQIAKPNGAPEGRKSSQVNVLSPLRGSRHVTLHPGFSHPGTGFGHPGLRGCRPSGAPETSILRSPPHFFDTLSRGRLHSVATKPRTLPRSTCPCAFFNTVACAPGATCGLAAPGGPRP